MWARSSTEWEVAEQHLQTAVDLLTSAGETHAAGRVSGRLGILELSLGRGEQGLRRMEEAFETSRLTSPTRTSPSWPRRSVRPRVYGRVRACTGTNELALRVAQALRLPSTLLRGLQAKSALARLDGRPEEELALCRHAVRYARENANDLPARSVGGAYGNLSDACFQGDRYGEALDALGRRSFSRGAQARERRSTSRSARRPTHSRWWVAGMRRSSGSTNCRTTSCGRIPPSQAS